MQKDTDLSGDPFAHAISQWIPIWATMPMHRQATEIRRLNDSASGGGSINPSVVATLSALGWILGLLSLGGFSGLIIFIYVLAMILELAILLWAQSDLNEYWRTTRGNNAESLPFSGER
jgi:hypothetical protein